MNNCPYCTGLVFAGKGVGTNSSYCRVECWFSAAAEEYGAAYNALMALEHAEPTDALAQLTAEITTKYPEIEVYF